MKSMHVGLSVGACVGWEVGVLDGFLVGLEVGEVDELMGEKDGRGVGITVPLKQERQDTWHSDWISKRMSQSWW
jgi:hypothetical protein